MYKIAKYWYQNSYYFITLFKCIAGMCAEITSATLFGIKQTKNDVQVSGENCQESKGTNRVSQNMR